MIPILYEKTEQDFSHNGIGFLSDVTKATVTEERNGIFELSLQYPTNGIWFDQLKNGSIIKAKANETSEPQLFRVYKISKPLQGVVTYSAEHISYRLNEIPTPAINFESATADEILKHAAESAFISCGFDIQSDVPGAKQFISDSPLPIRTVIGDVRDTFGGELEFDNFSVKLHKARGSDNGVVIEYGKNLTDLKQEENISECYTHILPYAAYQKEPEEYDENAEPETVFVYLSEKILPIPNAPEGDDYKVYIVDLSDRFEEGAEYSESALREVAEDYLVDCGLGVPNVNLTVSFIQLWQTEEYKNIASLERVKLCDVVTVKFLRLGVESKAKVIKTVFDVLNERYESITLGDFKETLADTIVKTERQILTIKKSTDRLESHIRRTDERITLEVKHIIEGEAEMISRIELTEEAIIAEVTRATSAEGDLSSKIELTAESITSTVTKTINEEVDRAKDAEGKLSDDLTKYFSDLEGQITSAKTEMSSEIKQTAEDITLSVEKKITAETDRAETVEAELRSSLTLTSDAIIAEVTRATSAEGDLSSKIELTADGLTSEISRASGIETELRSSITQTAESLTSEISRATAEEGELSSRITQTAEKIESEVTRATGAENSLNTTLSTKITQTVNAIRLSASSKTSGNETQTTVSITNGTTTLNSVTITGTTEKQAAAIIADSVKGITLSYTSTTANNQTTSVLTLKNGSATLGTATVVGTTASQAATIAADAVKGITLTVSNSSTGASSTLTLKSGSTTLSSGTIEFSGLVTFSNLTDGRTQISGNNITTGKISADRIDVSTLYVDRVYSGTSASRQVVLQANGTTSLIVGGNGSSTTGNVTTTNLLASSTVVIGRYVNGYSNNQYNLMFDVNNQAVYPNHTSPSYAWSLGTSRYWFNELYAVNVHLGNNTTAAKIGFFGATPQSKQTGITTLDKLITALKNYGLIG